MNRVPSFKFRLFVAGDAENSLLAVSNLKAFCLAHLPGRHEIEIVDVFRDPKRALLEGILMTPTLVKLAPLPLRRIVGTLSESAVLMLALGLEPQSA